MTAPDRRTGRHTLRRRILLSPAIRRWWLAPAAAVTAAALIGGAAAGWALRPDARVPPPEQAAPPPAAAPAAVDRPDFEVAFGYRDEPVEVPALQSAKTEWLSFGDLLVDSLDTATAVSDFRPVELRYDPQVVRGRVESGDAVLAVEFPDDFTATMVQDMTDPRGEPPSIPVTVYAGPQARADDALVLDQYVGRALRPALAERAGELRTVADELGVTDAGTRYAEPFAIRIVEVDGPAPRSYRYASRS